MTHRQEHLLFLITSTSFVLHRPPLPLQFRSLLTERSSLSNLHLQRLNYATKIKISQPSGNLALLGKGDGKKETRRSPKLLTY